MKQSKWETRYYVTSFFLSLYLLFSIAVSYMSFSESFKELNEKITVGILVFFIIELIVLFFISKNKKRFIKENWIAVSAIVVSLPFVLFLNVFAELGLVVAVHLMKAAKVLKGIKILKVVKGVKVLKSIKLGKKSVKSIKENKEENQV